MPRKPGSNVNIRNPIISSPSQRGNVADVRHINDAYEMRMNYNTGHIGIASIDGQAYPSITQKGLKEVFESCFVPMDDGNKVLVEPDRKTISQRGYGNIVKRKPVKVPKGNRPGITNQEVPTKHYTNVAVYSDFPKGVGKTDTQIVWRDGTYDEAVLSATKKPRGEVPDQTFSDLLRSNPRWAEYALSAETGANVFGSIQRGREVAKAIAEQEAIGKTPAERTLIIELATAGVPLVDIRRITEFLRNRERERVVREIADTLNIRSERLIDELRNIIPGGGGVSESAQRMAIQRYLEEQSRQERNRDLANRGEIPPFMAGARPPNVIAPSEMFRQVELEMRRRGIRQNGGGAEDIFNRPPPGANPLVNPMFPGVRSRGY
jgi:hypothetical protein